VLAHRDELISQAAEKLRMVDPTTRIGIVKAERDEREAPVVVASVQTLSRRSRLSRIAQDFSTVVVDEAHHATADTYIRILEHVGSLSDNGPLTLGVTATPERADGTPLGDVWQEIVYSADILAMIRSRYLCDLRAVRVHVEVDLDRVHTQAGDLVAGELDDALRAANAPGHVLTAYTQHALGRKALLFTPTVALAHDMAAIFVDAGIAAEALDGTTASEERREILKRLRSGETMVVANCAVLTEGFDEPSIDCIIVARPTKSRPLYVQMVGRGTRTWPGKTDCLIIDLVGSTKRHKLMSVSTLFGLEVEELHGASVVEATSKREQEQAAREAHGRLVAQTVDLFESRELHWIGSEPSRFVLSIGDGLLILRSADLAKWTVDHVTRDRERTQIAADLDLGYAQGVAEDYARKLGAGVLVSRTARWRQELATDKQIMALRRWRIPIRPGLTKGEASDLLAAAAGRAA
jgi:superfamily II DNA or RNA helicase